MLQLSYQAEWGLSLLSIPGTSLAIIERYRRMLAATHDKVRSLEPYLRECFSDREIDWQFHDELIAWVVERLVARCRICSKPLDAMTPAFVFVLFRSELAQIRKTQQRENPAGEAALRFESPPGEDPEDEFEQQWSELSSISTWLPEEGEAVANFVFPDPNEPSPTPFESARQKALLESARQKVLTHVTRSPEALGLYLEGYTLEQIRRKMCVAVATVFRRKDDAIAEVARKWGVEHANLNGLFQRWCHRNWLSSPKASSVRVNLQDKARWEIYYQQVLQRFHDSPYSYLVAKRAPILPIEELSTVLLTQFPEHTTADLDAALQEVQAFSISLFSAENARRKAKVKAKAEAKKSTTTVTHP